VRVESQQMLAGDDQDVLLAIVWMLPNGKHLFCACSAVMFSDRTHKTDKKNRPLNKIAIKDCCGKMKIGLHAFVPNERDWVFLWLFQVTSPSQLGTLFCKRVQLRVTDLLVPSPSLEWRLLASSARENGKC
jgi:hypothetical protein